MKVLIAGGAGFIGSELARFLSLDCNVDVSVIDINEDYINKNLLVKKNLIALFILLQIQIFLNHFKIQKLI